MKTETKVVIDGLTSLVLTIQEDRELGRWFRTLIGRPVATRAFAIFQVAQRLAQSGVNQDFLSSFRMLADPRVFETARMLLGE